MKVLYLVLLAAPKSNWMLSFCFKLHDNFAFPNGTAMQSFIQIAHPICSTCANNLVRLLGLSGVPKHPQGTPLRPHVGSWRPHQLVRVTNGAAMQSFIQIAQTICSTCANNLVRLFMCIPSNYKFTPNIENLKCNFLKNFLDEKF